MPEPGSGERPIDDPIPEKPIIDEPGKVIPVVDPLPGSGQPIREPEPTPEPGSG